MINLNYLLKSRYLLNEGKKIAPNDTQYKIFYRALLKNLSLINKYLWAAN